MSNQSELRELILKQLSSPLRPEDRADVIMRAITAYTNKHELQARIGELGWAKTASVWNIDIRLAELEQELEKL